MNIYYLKRIRKRYKIEDCGRYWTLTDTKKKLVSAHANYGIAFYYMFESYFGFFVFTNWIKKCRRRIMDNMYRENERLRSMILNDKQNNRVS